jgi:hypothetical protein
MTLIIPEVSLEDLEVAVHLAEVVDLEDFLVVHLAEVVLRVLGKFGILNICRTT